jgi:molybdopterin converting factor small subunit
MASLPDAAQRDPRLDGSSRSQPVRVKVVLMGELKRWAGRQEVTVELPEGSTVQTLAKKLSDLCGETFAQNALTKEKSIQPHVAVFIDGVQIGRLAGTQTILTGGKVELMLLPMYEGG